jgi:hypothetical protein
MIGGPLLLLIAPWGISRWRDAVNGNPIGTGTARCGTNGSVIHSPCKIAMRVSGRYKSTLPDGQEATIEWDDGSETFQFPDGSAPGFCDTSLSANKLSISSGDHVDWDLHAIGNTDNDIGHGDGQDALGLVQCNQRLYALFLKNRSDSNATLVAGNASSNEWTALLEAGSTISLPPDSVFAVVSETEEGIPIEDGDSQNLKIAATGGTLSYGLNYASCSQ